MNVMTIVKRGNDVTLDIGKRPRESVDAEDDPHIFDGAPTDK